MNNSAYDSENIFAKILRGEIPCDKVYEDDHVLAFRDISPQTPVHALVIPKGAYVDMDDFTSRASGEEIAGFMQGVSTVARELGLADNGYRAIANIGADANTEVPHLHVHILGGKNVGPLVAR